MPETPWEALVASGGVDQRDIPLSVKTNKPGWDWRAALPSWVWHGMSLDGSTEGWLFIKLSHTGSDTSRKIASEWDDVATGLFYYRDWTDSTLPFVAKGETYRSGFWFEKPVDALAFHRKFGGEFQGATLRRMG